MEKKITKATIKSFIKRTQKEDNLFIKNLSSFDGMVDCVTSNDHPTWTKTEKMEEEKISRYNLGVSGAWFVGNSRDYFEAYNDGELGGYKVYNCCGSFVIASKF